MIKKKIYPEVFNEESKAGHLKDHAVIGISPFNSFFVESSIEKLLRWSHEMFQETTIFIPEGLSIYTLMAKGYTENDAIRKTRRQDSYIKNKVNRVLKNIGLCENEYSRKILTPAQLMKNSKYMEVYSRCLDKFNTDPSFRDFCLSASKFVLQNMDISHENTQIGVKYFLYELPLFLDTPKILDVPSSFFVYHRTLPFINDLQNYKDLRATNQGFVIMNSV